MIIIANEDLSNKLKDEKKKFEDLLSGRQDIEEKIKRKTEKMNDDKLVVADQESKLAELRSLIDAEQAVYDEQSAELDLAKKQNKFEEMRSRDLSKKFAALTAKLDFIEQGYDYKGNVQGMNLEVFRQLMQTNQSVSGLR